MRHKSADVDPIILHLSLFYTLLVHGVPSSHTCISSLATSKWQPTQQRFVSVCTVALAVVPSADALLGAVALAQEGIARPACT